MKIRTAWLSSLGSERADSASAFTRRAGCKFARSEWTILWGLLQADATGICCYWTEGGRPLSNKNTYLGFSSKQLQRIIKMNSNRLSQSSSFLLRLRDSKSTESSWFFSYSLGAGRSAFFFEMRESSFPRLSCFFEPWDDREEALLFYSMRTFSA